MTTRWPRFCASAGRGPINPPVRRGRHHPGRQGDKQRHPSRHACTAIPEIFQPEIFQVHSSFFFLFEKLVVFVVKIAIDPRQLQRFDADNFVFGSAFIAGYDVAFFDFVQFQYQGYSRIQGSWAWQPPLFHEIRFCR